MKTGRRTHGEERKRLVGRRMQIAAEQAGYRTTTETAEALGLNQASISRYWTGKQMPNPDDLERYAELMGKPVWWFWLDAGDEAVDAIADSLVAIFDQVMAGSDLATAYGQVTGDTARFGSKERAALAAGTAPLREHLTREAGDWQQHPPRQRRALIDQLSAESLRETDE